MNERLKELRKELNLTQQELGQRVGVKGNTIATYEANIRTPSDAVVKSICFEFRINEEWFRTGEGEMFVLMTEDDEMLAFCADLCNGSDPLIAKIILYYARLPEEDKAFLRKMINDLCHLAK
ncbi:MULTISPECIES: helix-turn-helix domain-containing protein [Clostridia]|uniref:DNA-binding transcriptional regulator, XRE-family HTH domain n=1 Tax=Eubacterium aggregans TaxID=81409 RepID=A0A1H3XEV1_9FIRM|nr:MULTISPECIES: helix-turn-helix transcriptional regulator [Clostridia]MDD4691128.1 helix-turn-helix transcriptional regulator [Eubacterium aggregans]MEA5002715.1 helix-turn-helix transcriptional regulator [Christensenella sp.]SDZ97471.1 DNA-binding transcriptional regulator, XRE-family HTH domain [Eubacterium aggregans]